jgi:uncharacterized protein (TIGR02186 family)
VFARPKSTTIPLALLLLSIAPAQAGSRSDSVRVEPENIQIGIFYSGQQIQVEASTLASADIVMRITGAEEPLVLKKKGKKYGFLWMNVGDVHYEAVPTVYLLSDSRELDALATPKTLSRLQLGFDALKDRLPRGSKDGTRELFDELVKLKEKDDLFACDTTGVKLKSSQSGRQEAIGEFFLPAKAPVGDYHVDVFAFREDAGELIGSATIHLERTSLVSSLTSLATNYGLLYGCLAVAVAILAGLLTGWIFGR